LRIFLEPLHPARNYEPFATMARCLLGSRVAGVATVIDSTDAALPQGSTVVVEAGASHVFGAEAPATAELLEGAERAAREGHARLVTESMLSVLYAPLRPIPKLLVLGAGLDALPLVGMAVELGWRVTVADHRAGYLARAGFERAEQRVLVEPGALADELPLTTFDAVVVMSHHLPTDRKYLVELAAVNNRFVGVLGPRARRDRLLADLGADAQSLCARLKGPVGLDIGADSPESIALSIVAELQSTLASR
jgi:xanthine/CO dehydrogenase XdhC/CoxF family maturation factor